MDKSSRNRLERSFSHDGCITQNHTAKLIFPSDMFPHLLHNRLSNSRSSFTERERVCRIKDRMSSWSDMGRLILRTEMLVYFLCVRCTWILCVVRYSWVIAMIVGILASIFRLSVLHETKWKQFIHIVRWESFYILHKLQKLSTLESLIIVIIIVLSVKEKVKGW